MYAEQYKKLWKEVRRHSQLYLLLIVPIAYLVLFHYMPMYGIQLSFRLYDINLGITDSEWIGVENFSRFFNSYMFARVMKNTLSLSLYSLVANFPLPIILALALNLMRNRRYKKIVQVVTYAPHFISTTVLVGMMMTVLSCRNGLYGTFVYMISGEYPSDLFGSANTFPHLYVWSGIWQNLGWNAIIYVAALSGVSPELHEAAQIDGASRFQRVIHVDLVALLPTASIMLIMSAGNILSVGFDKVYLMQNNINLSASETISTYVYKTGLTGSMDFSFSTAVGLFNSLVNMSLLLSVNFITGRLSKTSLF